MLCVDNAYKYTSGQLKEYMNKNRINLQLTTLYSPSQNDIAKCLNHTFIKHAHTMLIMHNMLKYLWKEAVLYACYLYN